MLSSQQRSLQYFVILRTLADKFSSYLFIQLRCEAAEIFFYLI
jgi:hypothetical protein